MNDELNAQLLAHELLISYLLLLATMAHPEPKQRLEQIQEALAKLTPTLVAKRNLSPQVGDLALKHINSAMHVTFLALP